MTPGKSPSRRVLSVTAMEAGLELYSNVHHNRNGSSHHLYLDRLCSLLEQCNLETIQDYLAGGEVTLSDVHEVWAQRANVHELSREDQEKYAKTLVHFSDAIRKYLSASELEQRSRSAFVNSLFE